MSQWFISLALATEARQLFFGVLYITLWRTWLVWWCLVGVGQVLQPRAVQLCILLLLSDVFAAVSLSCALVPLGSCIPPCRMLAIL